MSQAEGENAMNEHDIQYHLKHRQQAFQIDGASKRQAQNLAHSNNSPRRRSKLKQIVKIVGTFILLIIIF